mmetsp:Transcript_46849/g.155284  ORF Transcript_46849/g.155284 Transcript_46849/m.155284 type:complete len:265 (-) Transcript_46849:965-1759(-)
MRLLPAWRRRRRARAVRAGSLRRTSSLRGGGCGPRCWTWSLWRASPPRSPAATTPPPARRAGAAAREGRASRLAPSPAETAARGRSRRCSGSSTRCSCGWRRSSSASRASSTSRRACGSRSRRPRRRPLSPRQRRPSTKQPLRSGTRGTRRSAGSRGSGGQSCCMAAPRRGPPRGGPARAPRPQSAWSPRSASTCSASPAPPRCPTRRGAALPTCWARPPSWSATRRAPRRTRCARGRPDCRVAERLRYNHGGSWLFAPLRCMK